MPENLKEDFYLNLCNVKGHLTFICPFSKIDHVAKNGCLSSYINEKMSKNVLMHSNASINVNPEGWAFPQDSDRDFFQVYIETANDFLLCM